MTSAPGGASALEGSVRRAGLRGARIGPWRRELLAFAELFAIAGLAFSQPAFDLMSKNVSLLLLRSTAPWQVVALTSVLLLAPVVAAYAIEVAIGIVMPVLRRWVHALLVGLFAAVLVEEAVKQASDLTPTPLVVLGVLGGVAASLLVRFVEAARTFLRFLAIAPLVFALLFLGFSPVSKIVFREAPASASGATIGDPKRVVMIVMDELPLGTLLDGSGRIDAELYPNFAALAGTSTWYRNTTTVAPYSDWAVPAIVTGQYPSDADAVPIANDYPDSIFRLLGDAYRMNVHEPASELCADNICPDEKASSGSLRNLAATLKDTAELWSEFARPERTEVSFTPPPGIPPGLVGARQFLWSLQPGGDRVFDYLHVMLPHQPWRYLPTLQDTQSLEEDLSAKDNLLSWRNEWSARIARERHILQTQAADTMLGQIVRRLRRLEAWDDSIVVVTSDHGVSFTAGQPIRSATSENADELLWTPLFVKAPGQGAGVVDDRPMETVDIVPTIADMIDLQIPWKMDGTSALGPPRPEFARRLYQWKMKNFQPDSALTAPEGKALRFAARAGFAEVLSRRAAEPVGEPGLRPYRIGEYADLIGQPAASLVQDDPNGPSVFFLVNPRVFDAVDPRSAFAPWAAVQGSVLGLQGERTLAFEVNGRIAGFGRAVPYAGETNGPYWVSLAPQFFRPGRNDVAVYAVSGPPDRPVLDPIAPAGSGEPR